MPEDQNFDSITLPEIPDKVLQEMNQLMTDRRYGIKQPTVFARLDKSDRVSQEFILYSLNDYMGHIQQCVAATKKMLPFRETETFLEDLGEAIPTGAKVLSIVSSIDLRKISAELLRLQREPQDVTISHLIPFVRLLFVPLIKMYYLNGEGIAKVYRSIYMYIVTKMIPTDPEALKQSAGSAVKEWYYIIDTVCTGMYPLLLRMTSPAMLSMYQLFYTRGSRISWLDVVPEDVLLPKDIPDSLKFKIDEAARIKEKEDEVEEEYSLPEDVLEGISLLERFFPEAGFQNLYSLPDLCAYFQPILQFQDAFTQLAPDNPLHQTMILFWILEESFRGFA